MVVSVKVGMERNEMYNKGKSRNKKTLAATYFLIIQYNVFDVLALNLSKLNGHVKEFQIVASTVDTAVGVFFLFLY